MADFRYPDFVALVINAARSMENPRLQASFVTEIGAVASRMVSNGHTVIDTDGGVLTAEPGRAAVLPRAMGCQVRARSSAWRGPRRRDRCVRRHVDIG